MTMAGRQTRDLWNFEIPSETNSSRSSGASAIDREVEELLAQEAQAQLDAILAGGDEAMPEAEPQNLEPPPIVEVSRENYIDLDQFLDDISDFVYATISMIHHDVSMPPADEVQRLNDSLKNVAEDLKEIFRVLPTYASPYQLQQRNKIIARAKALQDSLKYLVEAVKEINSNNTKQNQNKLFNTTQLLVGDAANFFLACETIWAGALQEQTNYFNQTLGQLVDLTTATDRYAASHHEEVQQHIRLALSDSIRFSAIVTAKGYDVRNLEIQKQLSDSCFFIHRATKGVGIVATKQVDNPNDPSLREKMTTLTDTIAEQVKKISDLMKTPVNSTTMSFLGEVEISEFANRYQLAYKELNDAYAKFVDSFKADAYQVPPGSDPALETKMNIALHEKKESIALAKIMCSNIGLLKEIFSRPSALELMRTTRSLAQTVSKFSVNMFKTAVECTDVYLRDQIMVGLQALLFHGIYVKLISSAKSVSYPIFAVDPSLLTSVRSLATVAAIIIEAHLEWERVRPRDTPVLTESDLVLPTLNILSYGRTLAIPIERRANVPAPVLTPAPSLSQMAVSGVTFSQADLDLLEQHTGVKTTNPAPGAAKPAAAKSAANNKIIPGQAAASSPPTSPTSASNASANAGAGASANAGSGKVVPANQERLGPPPALSDAQAYKAYMIKKYEIQQQENAEILRKKKEGQ